MAAPRTAPEPSSARPASGGRRVLAVIPARGGSKGVPAKNLAEVGGLPLVARAVRACLGAPLVTHVAVSTDAPDIAAAARTAGAEVVERPEDIAGDLATSEAAVLHAMDTHEARHGHAVDVVLLVQCTSPFLTPEDLQGVAAAVAENGADSALTVAPFHGFVWRDADSPAVTSTPDRAAAQDGASSPVREGRLAYGATHVAAEAYAEGASPARPEPLAAPGGGHGVNHDKAFRPRRQDRPQEYLETGAAYGMDAAGFRKAGHRFFGRTDLVRTDPARVLEIDDPHDLARARALAPLLDGEVANSRTAGISAPGSTHVTPSRADIDAVVLDFDGTQTDDRVLIDSEGREFVAVHRGDGLGIGALRRDAALKLLILSTEQNPVVAARARKLRVPVLHGIDRKDLALKQWCEEQGVAPERVLYVGNDVNDLGCFGLVGWPVAVASAHDVVRGAARAVTTAPGGAGAIREIASWILGPSL